MENKEGFPEGTEVHLTVRAPWIDSDGRTFSDRELRDVVVLSAGLDDLT